MITGLFNRIKVPKINVLSLKFSTMSFKMQRLVPIRLPLVLKIHLHDLIVVLYLFLLVLFL